MKNLILFLLIISIYFIGCKKEGCTYPEATNYDSKADTDDGSCIYPEPEEEEEEEEEVSAASLWIGNYIVEEDEIETWPPYNSVQNNYSISITEIDDNNVLIQNFLNCSSLNAIVTETSMVPVGLNSCDITELSLIKTENGFEYNSEVYLFYPGDEDYLYNKNGEATAF